VPWGGALGAGMARLYAGSKYRSYGPSAPGDPPVCPLPFPGVVALRAGRLRKKAAEGRGAVGERFCERFLFRLPGFV
jgi:hypothetical protein